MMFWKSMVVGMLVFFISANAGAVTTFSVEKSFYDYVYTAFGPLSRLTSQGGTISFEDRGFNKAIHLEWGGFDNGFNAMRMVNFGIALEKPITMETLIGIGLGFVHCDVNLGAPVKAVVLDAYGKVKLLKFGNGSLGSFIGARVVNPTPFGTSVVYKIGLDVSLFR